MQKQLPHQVVRLEFGVSLQNPLSLCKNKSKSALGHQGQAFRSQCSASLDALSKTLPVEGGWGARVARYDDNGERSHVMFANSPLVWIDGKLEFSGFNQRDANNPQDWINGKRMEVIARMPAKETVGAVEAGTLGLKPGNFIQATVSRGTWKQAEVRLIDVGGRMLRARSVRNARRIEVRLLTFRPDTTLPRFALTAR